MAEARLAAILAGDDPLVNVAPSHVTFEQACDEWLRWLEHDLERKRSYVYDASSVVRHHLIPSFGASTPIEDVTARDIDAFRDRLLASPLARGTVQKVMVMLHGVLERSRRKGWIAANPAADVDTVNVRPSDEFNVLTVEEVDAVARATTSGLLAAIVRIAAFTGLRQGELLAFAVAARRLR